MACGGLYEVGSDQIGSDGMGRDGARREGTGWVEMGWDGAGWDGIRCAIGIRCERMKLARDAKELGLGQIDSDGMGLDGTRLSGI